MKLCLIRKKKRMTSVNQPIKSTLMYKKQIHKSKNKKLCV